MRLWSSSIFTNVFLDLPHHVSASHCHNQGCVVSSEATQAVCIVDVYGLRPVQSGQLSRDVTKRIHAWLLLEWEMSQGEVVGKIRTHILCSIILYRKSCCLWEYVEKYGRAEQATDDTVTRSMRFLSWLTKATKIHSEYEIFPTFPWQ
jgi:hypothetical protein